MESQIQNEYEQIGDKEMSPQNDHDEGHSGQKEE